MFHIKVVRTLKQINSHAIRVSHCISRFLPLPLVSFIDQIAGKSIHVSGAKTFFSCIRRSWRFYELFVFILTRLAIEQIAINTDIIQSSTVQSLVSVNR